MRGSANIQPFWQAVMDIEASQVINFTGCNGLAPGTYTGYKEETMKKGCLIVLVPVILYDRSWFT
jgi:hypothetical protein